jgi:riboflavin biosynthesis pyrimidine reductase
MLRQITPAGEAVDDLLGLYMGDERRVDGRPWLMLNFVTSIDGGTTVGGTSTRLGDADDKELFMILRAVPDVILVGATTVAAEDYGPVRLDDERRRRRLEAGLSEVPVLAIVSGRLSVDPEARVFSDSERRPLIITGPDASAAKLAMLGDAADVIFLEDLTAPAILAQLGAVGVVLCEGGPTLAGQFVTAGLVDEVNLTLAPKMISGLSARMTSGAPADPPLGMRLDRALMGEESLFLRYLRA